MKEHIISEIKLIQLQLYLAKKSAKKIHTPLNTLSKVEIHIEHSLNSLNHLIAYIDDFQSKQKQKY